MQSTEKFTVSEASAAAATVATASMAAPIFYSIDLSLFQGAKKPIREQESLGIHFRLLAREKTKKLSWSRRL